MQETSNISHVSTRIKLSLVGYKSYKAKLTVNASWEKSMISISMGNCQSLFNGVIYSLLYIPLFYKSYNDITLETKVLFSLLFPYYLCQTLWIYQNIFMVQKRNAI